MSNSTMKPVPATEKCLNLTTGQSGIGFKEEPPPTRDTQTSSPPSQPSAPNPETLSDHLDWSPDALWLAAQAALHIVIALAWVLLVGWWVFIPAALLFARPIHVYRRRESWRFAFTDETVALLGPPQSGAMAVRPTVDMLRPIWMTDRVVVVRTRQRILTLRRGWCGDAQFARLRRALLGWSTSSGSMPG